MAAQGLTLLYLAIVAIYLIRMRHLDRQLKSDATDAR
jgi:putative solute:sodium symporter small subunit